MHRSQECSWGEAAKVTEIESEIGMHIYVAVNKLAEQSRMPMETIVNHAHTGTTAYFRKKKKKYKY